MDKMTFRSVVTWTGQGLSSDARSGPHTIRIDEPKDLGGAYTGPSPVELLLSALGGCFVALVNALAPAYGVEIKDVKVDVRGDLDPNGVMGTSDARPGFSQIHYNLEIDSPSPAEKIEELRNHVVKVCPVKDTLSGIPVEAV